VCSQFPLITFRYLHSRGYRAQLKRAEDNEILSWDDYLHVYTFICAFTHVRTKDQHMYGSGRCMYIYTHTYTYIYVYILTLYMYVLKINICVGLVDVCTYTHIHIYIYVYILTFGRCGWLLSIACCMVAMGWLRLVGFLKSQVSFAEYRLFHRALLQKRPMILRSILIVATP